jgi:hypothetical protein
MKKADQEKLREEWGNRLKEWANNRINLELIRK